MRFEWDFVKARDNFRKHGVSFEEASSVFDDRNAALRFDKEHSQVEDRYLLCGHSNLARLLMVSHSYSDDDSVRLISARRASPNEFIAANR